MSRYVYCQVAVKSNCNNTRAGISLKTQLLYVIVFVTRYIDLLSIFIGEWISFYNFIMKIFFISSSGYIIYLMRYRFRCVELTYALHITLTPSRPTNDPSIDTFKMEYLLGPCALLGLIFKYEWSFMEILWSFSIWLESVAILPQLFMLQRTGEAETITTHYLAALGAYRALYIPNWIYRCVNMHAVKILYPDVDE